MPRIVFGIDFIEDQSVIDDDRSKVLLGLTVVKSFPVFPDLVQQRLPLVDILTQFIIYFFGIDNPQGLVIVPFLEILLSIFEYAEDILVGFLQDLSAYLEQYVLVVLFSFLLFNKRALILVRLESLEGTDESHCAMKLLSPYELGMLQGRI